MVALTERGVRQHLISTLIDTDPIVVDLTRPVMTETSSGGVVQTGSVVISDQKFFFVPFKRRLTEELQRNPQSYGEDYSRDIEYIFIFMPSDSDIQEGDLFTMVDQGYLEPGDYRVTFLSKRVWDRQQAVVRLRG